MMLAATAYGRLSIELTRDVVCAGTRASRQWV